VSEDKKVTAKKVTAKKVTAKKVTAKKVTAKKVTAKKVTAKKVTAKKVTAKTAPTKTAPTKTAPTKTVADKSLQSVLSPHVTEKATMVADKLNQVIFKVRKDATKIQVKEAIETMFKVDVKNVNLLNVKGKTKRASRNSMGKRADWKKAYVSIQAGQEINFTGE
jgi:large subunit ribosomal protein L23